MMEVIQLKREMLIHPQNLSFDHLQNQNQN